MHARILPSAGHAPRLARAWSITNLVFPMKNKNLCFAFSAFLVFYHGIHETSLYEVSIATALFLVSFMIFDRSYLLNMIFAEYIVIMAIQFV